ncbi:hypothetical protein M433DRAFT_161398, partial [Acidomyces richmondensis BFW]
LAVTRMRQKWEAVVHMEQQAYGSKSFFTNAMDFSRQPEEDQVQDQEPADLHYLWVSDGGSPSDDGEPRDGSEYLEGEDL